jgi:hypothetical protein
LALDSLRNVLMTFFACYTVPPGLYVPADGFLPDGSLTPAYADHARSQGQALLELTAAVMASRALRSVAPQA